MCKVIDGINLEEYFLGCEEVKFEIKGPKPDSRIYANPENFSAKTPEGKDAFWKPSDLIHRNWRSSYINYFLSSYRERFEKNMPEEERLTSTKGIDNYGRDRDYLEDRALDRVSAALGLEDNELRCNLPYGVGRGIYGLKADVDKRNMKYLKRTFGFLGAVKEGNFPALDSLVKGMTGRGYNSPHAIISIQSLAIRSKCFNPGKLNRAIYAAREAARSKHGYRCSFKTAARAVAVVGVRSPGKAATVALAISFGFDRPRHYREARDFVIKVLLAKRKGRFKDVDGVLTSTRERVSKGPVKRYKAVWLEDGWRYITGYLFTAGEDSYHCADGTDWKWGIRNLKKKRSLRVENLNLTAIISNSNSSPLIYVEDSYAAGNCLPGTREFLRENGISTDTRIISLKKVYDIAIKGNELAMNAVKEAVRHLKE